MIPEFKRWSPHLVCSLVLATLGCSEQSDDPRVGSLAGTSSAESGIGGTMTGGGSDAGPTTTTGGVGGTSAGTGGGAGISIDDVDLTLGGLNQDLPAPTIDCLDAEVGIGCMAVRGEVNREAFELSCDDQDVGVLSGDEYVCRGVTSVGELDVRLHVSHTLVLSPPVAFALDAPEDSTQLRFVNFDRDMDSYTSGWSAPQFALSETHDQVFGLAGAAELLDREYRNERVSGVFALSIVPKSSCTPDAMDLGCDEVRLRGNFRAVPIR